MAKCCGQTCSILCVESWTKASTDDAKQTCNASQEFEEMTIEITMKYKKSTPNTYVFEEVAPEPESDVMYFSSIPSLYIRKSAMTKPAQEIKVTMEILK